MRRTQTLGVTVDRTRIAREALDLLDEVGLEGLTVRRLAARLNVKSPALYWHFRSKQELLDEMAQELQSTQDLGPPRSGEAWRDWLSRRTLERRRVLLSRRDGARLVAGARPAPSALTSFEKELQALVEFGFTPLQAVRAVTTLGHYVSGFVLEEQAEWQRQSTEENSPADDVSPEERGDPLASVPILAEAIAVGGSPGGGDAAFEDGMAMLLDGLSQRLVDDGANT